MPPESLKDSKKNGFCGKMADIFSFGVTCYCLMYRKLPFQDDNIMELFNQIQKKEPEFEQGPPEQLINLVQGMLAKNPKNRITLEQILEDPWFKESYPSFDYDQYMVDQQQDNVNNEEKEQ